jgi:hypothetical protein
MEHLTLMRRILTLSVLCLAVAVVNACRPDEIIETQAIPSAGVRFIHAVPDTGLMDFRFVDFPENNVQWQIAFRNTPTLNAAGANGVPVPTFVEYKPARAGGGSCASTTSCQRHFRIFMNPNCSPSACNAILGAVVVKDTTVTLEPGKLYTAILWGYANPTGPGRPAGAPAMRLTFVEDVVADPAANVAMRVINASTATIDARYYPAAGAAPGTTIQLAMAPLTMSNYVTDAPAQYRFNIDLAGTATNPFANGIDRIALVGAAAVTAAPGPFDAIPGTSVAGSAVTGIVFAPSVVGTAAPQGAGTATIPPWNDEAIVYVWDRRPPRPPGV